MNSLLQEKGMNSLFNRKLEGVVLICGAESALLSVEKEIWGVLSSLGL